MVRNRGRLILILLVSFHYIMATACKTVRPLPYFYSVKDSLSVSRITVPDLPVQRGDLLLVTVYSDNPDATLIFNQAGSAPAAATNTGSNARSLQPAGSTVPSPTYKVDMNGEIFMHRLGPLRVAGLTRKQVGDLVLAKLKALDVLTNPYVVVQLSGFKVTVVGEVKSPGVITIPGDKATVFDAMAMAGDIGDFGLKDKVMLVREVNGERTLRKINLLDSNFLSSPDYYLRQNDLIIVEASTKKPTLLDQQRFQYISAFAAIASTIAIFISIFK